MRHGARGNERQEALRELHGGGTVQSQHSALQLQPWILRLFLYRVLPGTHAKGRRSLVLLIQAEETSRLRFVVEIWNRYERTEDRPIGFYDIQGSRDQSIDRPLPMVRDDTETRRELMPESVHV